MTTNDPPTAEPTEPERQDVEKNQPSGLGGELKLFGGILVVAAILVGAALYPTLIHPDGASQPAPAPHAVALTRAQLAPQYSPVLGPANAPFLLVEFGDFQCPTCKAAEPEVKRELSEHSKLLQLVFHAVRITPTHSNTLQLAVAAYAANKQGKFWKMHDALYEYQDTFREVEKERLTEAISQAGASAHLDLLRFESDLADTALQQSVNADMKLMELADVKGTPSFFFCGPSGKPVMLVSIKQMTDWLDNPRHWKQ